MTGQGQAQGTGDFGTISVELRTVNNRGLKLSARLGDRLGQYESRIDSVVREHLSRGTVNLNVRWQRTDLASVYSINGAALSGYYRSLAQLHAELGASTPIDVGHLVMLPGVVEEAGEDDIDAEAIWKQLDTVLREALGQLNEMRSREGGSMQRTLQSELDSIASHLEHVRQLAPTVVESYRERLEGKIDKALSERGLEIAATDILKEVQIFADRSDISEEITRLGSHLEMFSQTMDLEQSSGRRLDFVIQEMFRETNTIGSKASDAVIAGHVVDMKCAIERMRELVQNIE